MIHHHSLSTHSCPGSAQRFTVVPEPISLIGRRLSGCSGRKTYQINRAPERINELLRSGSLWVLPPIRLFYSFVSLPLTITIKHTFLLCDRTWCVNVGLLMNLNAPAMNVVLFHYTALCIKWRKGYSWWNVNRQGGRLRALLLNWNWLLPPDKEGLELQIKMIWICYLILMFFH